VLLGFVPFADHLEDELSGPRQDEEEAGNQAERVAFVNFGLAFGMTSPLLISPRCAMVTLTTFTASKHCWPMGFVGFAIRAIWTASVRLLRRSFCGTAEYGGHVEGETDFDVVLA
jgi:hypothetical protein